MKPTDTLARFKDPALCGNLLDRIRAELDGPLAFMEVCGTHTMAIFQSGLHSLLPPEIRHLSGPGCPVCVTHEGEVAAFLEMAGKDDVIIATFGDLMRVPGPRGTSLKLAQAEGCRIEVVYSAFDALALAQKHPTAKIVFLGVGFETTAPTVAATVKIAAEQGLNNFFVFAMHKLVPPALSALLQDPDVKVDALLLPGHVSTIIGTEPYQFLATDHGVPSIITGFEPLDILQALLLIIEQRKTNQPTVVNQYSRAVADAGNPQARKIMSEVFAVSDALWRGLGTIPHSGLTFHGDYRRYDAREVLGVEVQDLPPLPGCRCGDVLKGKMKPSACPLFSKACTPASPVGPCMVSTEGSCAAYYKYAL
ncbi:hydrogenase formation protein HypD [Desulfonatronum thiosulfatophilum]|uniref:hydrogenase formation protein HypD n=1 Tax=Desulfonatronum thiosulfatophilum TaxID=617002 RepID=UPI000AFF8B6D|nr:hydrogenase formation protein HypD [Desulfonatronum thiosulfatophilum]